MAYGISGPGGYERQLAALGAPTSVAVVVKAGDPPPATVAVPTPSNGGYSGLGIFPWETPAGVGFRAPWTPQNGSGGGAPLAAAALPAGAAAALGALGLGGLAAGAGTLYGLSQAIGVQYPWETGPGEGFIAPWNREIVQDETGRWVTRSTRPDLFNGASTAVVPAAGGGAMAGGFGPQVVKTWAANGWPFAMTSDGRIHTVTKNGIRKSWRPYRSIVLGKKLSIGMAKRAVRRLQSIKEMADAIEKLGGTRTVYRKAK